MNVKKQINAEDLEVSEILKVIDNITKKEITFGTHTNNITYDKFISYKNICEYGTIFYFEDFYIIKYFNILYIFVGTVQHEKVSKIFSKSKEFEKYVNDNCIGIILNNKLISNSDFSNLKKCYMLTKPISYTEDSKIYCKYTPYHLIELTLLDNTLTIYIKRLNCYCEINTSNINGYLKDFLKEVFDEINEDSLKLHHQILKYYASLD